jgi:hypothetical protein
MYSPAKEDDEVTAVPPSSGCGYELDRSVYVRRVLWSPDRVQVVNMTITGLGRP